MSPDRAAIDEGPAWNTALDEISLLDEVGADLVAQHYAEAYGMHIQVTRMFTHTGLRRGDVFAESSFAKQIAMIEAGKLSNPVMVGNLDEKSLFLAAIATATLRASAL